MQSPRFNCFQLRPTEPGKQELSKKPALSPAVAASRANQDMKSPKSQKVHREEASSEKEDAQDLDLLSEKQKIDRFVDQIGSNLNSSSNSKSDLTVKSKDLLAKKSEEVKHHRERSPL